MIVTYTRTVTHDQIRTNEGKKTTDDGLVRLLLPSKAVKIGKYETQKKKNTNMLLRSFCTREKASLLVDDNDLNERWLGIDQTLSNMAPFSKGIRQTSPLHLPSPHTNHMRTTNTKGMDLQIGRQFHSQTKYRKHGNVS